MNGTTVDGKICFAKVCGYRQGTNGSSVSATERRFAGGSGGSEISFHKP